MPSEPTVSIRWIQNGSEKSLLGAIVTVTRDFCLLNENENGEQVLEITKGGIKKVTGCTFSKEVFLPTIKQVAARIYAAL